MLRCRLGVGGVSHPRQINDCWDHLYRCPGVTAGAVCDVILHGGVVVGSLLVGGGGG